MFPPQVLLLDEITVDLDVLGRAELMRFLMVSQPLLPCYCYYNIVTLLLLLLHSVGYLALPCECPVRLRRATELVRPLVAVIVKGWVHHKNEWVSA